MRISLKAIKKFVPVDLDAKAIAEKLDKLGIEVEAIEEMRPSFSGVIVARVESTKPHPNADRLTLARVFDGKNHYDVVCAATNCLPGLFAFAPIGAEIESDGERIKIREAKLRGELSQGMLLAEDELGLAIEKSPGIWELNPSEKPGDLIDVYFEDTVFHIGLTPNLAHCQSVYGIARELAAHLNLPLIPLPKPLQAEVPGLPVTLREGCEQYTLTEVTIAQKPTRLAMRGLLNAHGIRAISLPVDCTNAIMTTYGLPTHAFDGKTLHHLFIGPVEKPALLTTLDGKERQLEPGDFAIFNDDTPIAIAGALGGESTEVSAETTHIAFEAAVFDSTAVRRTCRRLSIRTEGSARFERGADPAMPLIAAAVFVDELKKATTLSGNIRLTHVHTTLAKPRTITLRPSRVRKIIGLDISTGEITSILEGLGFTLKLEQEDLLVSVPSWRGDVTVEVDLIEEIARLWGYDKLPTTTSLWSSSALGDDPRWHLQKKTRLSLLRLGAQEMLTCNLISEEMLRPWEKSLDLANCLRVTNASIVQHSWLRPSLLPGLCQATCHNISRGQRNVFAFEVGSVHFETGEPINCAIVWTGSALLEHFTHPKRAVDFFDIKAVCDGLLASFDLPPHTLWPSAHESLHPHQQGALMIGECTIGHIGRCHPLVEERIGCPPLFVAEICLTDLIEELRETPPYQSICPFPTTSRDWTLLTKRSMPYAALEKACLSGGQGLLKKVELISLYTGEHTDQDHHSVSVRLTYQKEEATLSHNETEEVHTTLQSKVRAALADYLA